MLQGSHDAECLHGWTGTRRLTFALFHGKLTWRTKCQGGCTGLDQLVASQQKTYVTRLREVCPSWAVTTPNSPLYRCRGDGHRSAFCKTNIDARIELIHRCERLSTQEMDVHFPCNVAAKFVEPCYTTPKASSPLLRRHCLAGQRQQYIC